jgi:hypothetical protein
MHGEYNVKLPITTFDYHKSHMDWRGIEIGPLR